MESATMHLEVVKSRNGEWDEEERAIWDLTQKCEHPNARKATTRRGYLPNTQGKHELILAWESMSIHRAVGGRKVVEPKLAADFDAAVITSKETTKVYSRAKLAAQLVGYGEVC